MSDLHNNGMGSGAFEEDLVAILNAGAGEDVQANGTAAPQPSASGTGNQGASGNGTQRPKINRVSSCIIKCADGEFLTRSRAVKAWNESYNPNGDRLLDFVAVGNDGQKVPFAMILAAIGNGGAPYRTITLEGWTTFTVEIPNNSGGGLHPQDESDEWHEGTYLRIAFDLEEQVGTVISYGINGNVYNLLASTVSSALDPAPMCPF